MSNPEQQPPVPEPVEDDERPERDPERVHAAVAELVAFLRAGASAGSQRLDLTARMVADVVETELYESLGDGSTGPAAVDEPRLSELLGELREADYDPDEDGAWFSLRLYVRPDGPEDEWWQAVDHFREPSWRVPPPDAKYGEDLKRFPREYSELPDWLSAKAPDA
ncbi:hypothetical protein KDK95_02445 [Actinospica sp. MGRD01-02]|uniref:Uncharacterized protein n=1 Tax=Actinospica acidithermotolerans TaxID=2828514 RepID=A0A941IEF0_9ACTN|nr:hypothetical protein [Actinospica acidithermotolerans]MBR7825150.1 hypothetical protein [Actinospica acidithermotolerans]